MSSDALSVLSRYGLEVFDLIPETLQRVNGEGDSGKAGWYVYYTDPECLIYGDWRIGESNVWKPEGEINREDAAIISRKVKEAKAKGIDERVKKNEEAEGSALTKWKSAVQTDDHPYLESKQIMANTARAIGDELVIPIYSPEKKVVSLQSIFANGDKRFLTGGRIKGCFTPIKGSMKTIYLCEGYATGETIHGVTGAMIFCSLTAGNLKEVAEWISDTFPCNELVICGDDDHETKVKIGENPGKLKAEAAAVASGATVIFPKFKDKKGRSDFNDMISEPNGVARLEDIIFNRPAPSALIFDTIGEIMQEAIKPKEWLIKDLLLMNTTASLYGPSGSLKSFFAIDLGLSIACGKSYDDAPGFLGKAIRQGKVMYLAGEGMDGIRGRLQAWTEERGLTVPGENFLVSRGASMVDKAHERKRLIAMVRKCRPELLIIDTLRRNFSGHENDSKDISDFVAAIDEIRNSCRCTVLVVAHTGKDTTRGEMGSVVLRNALDTRIRLKRLDEDAPEDGKDAESLVSVIISKQKDGKEGHFIDFGRKLWKSSQLEDYTSLTIEYLGEPKL